MCTGRSSQTQKVKTRQICLIFFFLCPCYPQVPVLSRKENNLFFSCCISSFNILCILRCFSAHQGCRGWLSCPFYSDLSYQQGVSTSRILLKSFVWFFEPFCVTSRVLKILTPAIWHQQPSYLCWCLVWTEALCVVLNIVPPHDWLNIYLYECAGVLI